MTQTDSPTQGDPAALPPGEAPAAETFRSGPAPEAPLDELVARAGEVGIAHLANALIEQAAREDASDIHVEPGPKGGRVRYRVDGVLHRAATLPADLLGPLVSRIKLMAEMDASERRLPQTGSLHVRVDRPEGPRDYALRAATLPTLHGESLVLRLVDSGAIAAAWTWEKLGLMGTEAMEALLRRPHGLILFAGPAGSGKKTVLCAALNSLDRVRHRVVMIDDDIGVRIPGVSLSLPRFPVAEAVRALVACDPDVIGIGELRRREEVEAALDAALEGHLVLACLYAADAPAGIERLLARGVPARLVSAGLAGVVGSRLVRRVCPECRQPYTPGEAELHALGIPAQQAAGASFARGAGCEQCRGTGYRGRLGLFEILNVDAGVAALVAQGITGAPLRRQLAERGFAGFRADGAQKALAGLTTAEEVLRVTSDLEVTP